MSALLEMRGITKEYRGIPAVKDVDFTLETGEIHAILGENGAGKSTLTKVIAGAVPPTRGTMLLDGKPVVFTKPADALRAGIAMVYQENSLVPALECRAEHLSGARAVLQQDARHQHRRPAIPAVAELPGRSHRHGREPGGGQAPDGRDCARRSTRRRG